MATKTTNKPTGLAGLLSTAKKSWGDTVEAKKQGQYAEWNDGKYIGQLVAATIKQANNANADWGVLSQYLILEGEREGDSYYEWLRLFDEDNTLTSFVIQRLELLTGTDAAELDIEELEGIFTDAVDEGKVFPMTLKTTTSKANGNSYQNLRLAKQLEGYAASEEEDEEEEEEEEPAKPAPKATPKAAPAKAATPATPAKTPRKAVTPPPCEVGDEVSFNFNGKELTGIVEGFNPKTEEVNVKVGKKVYAVDYADVTVSEPEEEDEEEETSSDISLTEGDEVTFELNGKELTGTIVSVDDEEEEAQVKVGKKTHTVAFDDITPVESEEDETENEEDDEEGKDEDGEEAELEVGSSVEFTDPKTKKQLTGTVVSIDEETLKVKVKVGAKTFTVDAEELVILETE